MEPSGFRVIDFGGRAGGLEHKMVQRESIFHRFSNLKSQPAEPCICPKDTDRNSMWTSGFKRENMYTNSFIGVFLHLHLSSSVFIDFPFPSSGRWAALLMSSPEKNVVKKKKILHTRKKGMLLYFPRLPLHIFPQEACHPADPGIEHEAPPRPVSSLSGCLCVCLEVAAAMFSLIVGSDGRG